VKKTGTKDAPHLKVVGITGSRECGNIVHVTGLVLANDSRISDEDAVSMIDAGRVLFMVPPPGTPARPVYEATGLPFILQTMDCPDCRRRVVFA
jgi:hypothetical protein